MSEVIIHSTRKYWLLNQSWPIQEMEGGLMEVGQHGSYGRIITLLEQHLGHSSCGSIQLWTD